MDLANELKVKFVCHLSSVGVVGKTRSRIVTEDAACSPMNLYEETKLAAEEIARRGVEGGRVVILRPTNIFGAAIMDGLLNASIFDKWALFLKGNESAHLVYVEDVSAAAVYCWQNVTGMPVETFIVSSDEEGGVTHKEIHAELACLRFSAPSPIRFAAPIILPYLMRVARNKKANFGNVIYSAHKLCKSGFQFPYGLRQGLRHAVRLFGDRQESAG